MKLSTQTCNKIADSPLFVCIIPEQGIEDATEGMEQLKYAVSLNKPILYWVPIGREVTVPEFSGVVIKGDAADVGKAIRQFFESDGPFELVDGMWDK